MKVWPFCEACCSGTPHFYGKMNVILIKLDLKGLDMIQKTALRVIKSKRLVLLALIMSSILQSLSIVGQAWFLPH